MNSINHVVFLSLGSNQGNRMAYIQDCIHTLMHDPRLTIDAKAGIYESDPVGTGYSNAFLNTVLQISTNLSPKELMILIQTIEAKAGRIRNYGEHQDRTLDIDLLFYDDCIMEEADCRIPHPRLHERNFVLVPMMEIAPEWIHPVYHKSIEDLYLECQDTIDVIQLLPA